MSADEQVRSWLERELGQGVVALERQERRRAAWFATLADQREIYVRGQEAAGLAGIAALVNQDAERAHRAVLCNALYLAATPGWLIGLLDTEAVLPEVVRS